MKVKKIRNLSGARAMRVVAYWEMRLLCISARDLFLDKKTVYQNVK